MLAARSEDKLKEVFSFSNKKYFKLYFNRSLKCARN